MVAVPDARRPTDAPTGLRAGGLRGAIQGGMDVLATKGEGLRERKKRETRQQISNVATGMFLDRGFDEVRVADVAAACGVSEKTVYNYFPTKESLLLDREDAMAESITMALGPGAPPGSPIDATVALLDADLERDFVGWEREHDRPFDRTMINRFAELIEQTPSLQAAQLAMMERLGQVAAQALADRAGMDPDEPEPQITATAISGLFQVQYAAMRRHAETSETMDELRELVMGEVRRAARLLDTGLWSFGLAVQGASGREQLKAAADASNEARKQVLVAIKQAREAWRTVVEEAQAHRAEHEERHGDRGDRDRGRGGPWSGGPWGGGQWDEGDRIEWAGMSRAQRAELIRGRHEAQRELQQAHRELQKAQRAEASALRAEQKAQRERQKAQREALKAEREATSKAREQAKAEIERLKKAEEKARK